MPRLPVSPDRAAAKKLLEDKWDAVLHDDTECSRADIVALVNSDQTAIRFCLPTQLLGKLTDRSLDALCLQRGDGEPGRWDPRGFAVRVVVPWNRKNQSVLGPSGDPYVSNPLRRHRLDDGLEQMADRDQWEALCKVLRDTEDAEDEDRINLVFTETLRAVRDRLRQFDFTYLVPARISLTQTITLTERFLSEPSGGDRGLAVAAAFFEMLGRRLNVYAEVRRGVVNAADAATGAAGDLECIGADGTIALAVEVKERNIADADVHDAVAKARKFAVRELIFCCPGIVVKDRAAIEQTFAAAWASGTNLYRVSLMELIGAVLPLLGEDAIRSFVFLIGRQLDAFSTQPLHRRAWKTLLDSL